MSAETRLHRYGDNAIEDLVDTWHRSNSSLLPDISRLTVESQQNLEILAETAYQGLYRQRGAGPFHLIGHEGGWKVEHKEGYDPLVSETASPVPPRTGWHFRKGPSLLAEPLLSVRLSAESSFPCSTITISSSSARTLAAVQDYLGTFR